MLFIYLCFTFILFQTGISENEDYDFNDNLPDALRRVIGGKSAEIADFSSTACLIRKTQAGLDFRGGAAIIGEYWVLTTAHCMTYISLADITNGLAFVHSNSRTWNKHYVEHNIIESYSHEKYNHNITDFDIGVLKVKQPFRGPNERPVKLPDSSYKYIDHSQATALGWGTTDARAIVPYIVSHLKYVNIKLMNSSVCKDKYRQAKEVVTKRMICASSPGKDACIYDSGGPLYQNDFLIGLVSWGSHKCADRKLPGVYTKVSAFYNWINQKMLRSLKYENNMTKYYYLK